MTDLKISIIQSDLFWENIEANLGHLKKILAIQDNIDLIILPEMFSTGLQ